MGNKIKIFFKGPRGYVSNFTLFLIAVFLIAGGFYGWEKYQEKKYPDKAVAGEIRGISYYLSGIGEKINLVLEKKDIKNKRAMELAESAKIMSDKAGFYSLEVPQSWVAVLNEAGKNNKLSSLVMQSSYFSARETDKKKYYDAGAKFSVSIAAGENKNILEGNGGHLNLIKKGSGSGQGGEYIYHIFKDPDSENGQAIDGHIIHNGNTYLFSMIYNPQTFTDAEYTFQEILNSIKFK